MEKVSECPIGRAAGSFEPDAGGRARDDADLARHGDGNNCWGALRSANNFRLSGHSDAKAASLKLFDQPNLRRMKRRYIFLKRGMPLKISPYRSK